MTKHRIRWFVYAGGERLPHTSFMRGSWDGWDAVCSCGWKATSAGCIKARVQDDVRIHKLMEGIAALPKVTPVSG